MSVFGSDYANAYDSLYASKDYPAECDRLESFFEELAEDRVRTVLDLGCGTGGHMAILTERGYQVVGVDVSADMVRRAQAKMGSFRDPPPIVVADIREVGLGRSFDACILMFAVLGYQVENKDVVAVLDTARRHLQPGGLLIFDVWYGPAVLRLRPSEKFRVSDEPDGQVLRVSTGELQPRRNACTVRMRVWTVDRHKVTTDVHEEHTVRYFFEPELRMLLDTAGFESVEVSAFSDGGEPTDETWNVFVTARAR